MPNASSLAVVVVVLLCTQLLAQYIVRLLGPIFRARVWAVVVQSLVVVVLVRLPELVELHSPI